MLILVCFQDGGCVPALWLNHSRLTLSCECTSLGGRCSLGRPAHTGRKGYGASEPSSTAAHLSRSMWFTPHKKYLNRECSELPRFKGSCKNMTFCVLVQDRAKWSFKWEKTAILELSPMAHLKVWQVRLDSTATQWPQRQSKAEPNYLARTAIETARADCSSSVIISGLKKALLF